MKLYVDPPPSLRLFQQEIDLLICIRGAEFPNIYTRENSAKPDRHFLLGVLQAAMIAVDEQDEDTVAFIDSPRLSLEKSNELIQLSCQMLIITNKTAFAVLTGTDKAMAKRLIREAARHFTGMIRLDIP